MSEVTKKPMCNKAALLHFMEAFEQFCEQGNSVVRCDHCHAAIEFHRLGDDAWQSNCPCGKYTDTLRGI